MYAIEMKADPANDYSLWIAIPFLALALLFVWRSFFKMRIPYDVEQSK